MLKPLAAPEPRTGGVDFRQLAQELKHWGEIWAAVQESLQFDPKLIDH